MQRDRFLWGILAGIGVLVVAALILFFIRQGKVGYVEAGTPEGVLQNYMLAIQRQEYERAYEYLADYPEKPDQLAFQQAFLGYQHDQVSATSVEINDTVIDEPAQTALVQVALVHGSGDIFGDTYRDQQTATLVLQSGSWKIYQAPYPYWGGNWAIPGLPKALPSSSPTTDN